MKSSDLIKMLVDKGWYLHRIKGSHHHFRHPSMKGLVTIPHPTQELPKGTVKSIMRQASLFRIMDHSIPSNMEKNIAISASCY
jgi:predicted RNA binding protein YcfA (HicA-like mRNA interferase family)